MFESYDKKEEHIVVNVSLNSKKIVVMVAFRVFLTVFFLAVIFKKKCFCKQRMIWNELFADDSDARVFLKTRTIHHEDFNEICRLWSKKNKDVRVC